MSSLRTCSLGNTPKRQDAPLRTRIYLVLESLSLMRRQNIPLHLVPTHAYCLPGKDLRGPDHQRHQYPLSTLPDPVSYGIGLAKLGFPFCPCPQVGSSMLPLYEKMLDPGVVKDGRALLSLPLRLLGFPSAAHLGRPEKFL
jgi:hypothetical protein